jgi:hypothetical protein
MIEPKCLAPAKLQRIASLLILKATMEGMEDYVKPSQEASMMRESNDIFHWVI